MRAQLTLVSNILCPLKSMHRFIVYIFLRGKISEQFGASCALSCENIVFIFVIIFFYMRKRVDERFKIYKIYYSKVDCVHMLCVMVIINYNCRLEGLTEASVNSVRV